MTSQEIQDKLAAPFPLSSLGFRPQSAKGNRAIALPYIDSRDVQNRLDKTVGVANWQDEYHVLNDGSVLCQLKVRVNGEWVAKCDVGSPSEQPDSGDRMKAAVSDALKRAAVKWGIGRYLYYIDTLWGDYDPTRKQFTDQWKANPGLPFWALPKPDGQPAPQSQQAQRPQPQNQPAQQSQSLAQQSQPPAQTAGGDVLAGCLGAINSSMTAVELQAAVFAAKAHIDAKRLAGDGAVKVGDAIQAKVVSLVGAAATKQGLDDVYAVYEKSIMPLMNEQRRAAVLQAFNGKTFETAEEEAFA